MTPARVLVVVVDDDDSVRESLPDLLYELGFSVRAFGSAEAFLASDAIGEARCLVVDIDMPGTTGPELLHELKRRGHDIPSVFMTAYTSGDQMRGVMESGAITCLFKPFTESALLEAIDAALRTGRS